MCPLISYVLLSPRRFKFNPLCFSFLVYLLLFDFLVPVKHDLHCSHERILIIAPMCFQIVKVWSEDGAGKVVEIPADMTARDVCQLLVYKSHCVDDNAWTLVEHHPILGLGKTAGLQICAEADLSKCALLFLQELT